jgi:hypothetical protein
MQSLNSRPRLLFFRRLAFSSYHAVMEFDLTDLRLFVRTAEEGNLTRAAARQHLSLAATSSRIKALESHAGMPLIYREARGVRG